MLAYILAYKATNDNKGIDIGFTTATDALGEYDVPLMRKWPTQYKIEVNASYKKNQRQ